jgi:hypothetical protein
LVDYDLWYVPTFPLDRMGGKLDKDPEDIPWIMGLLADIERAGRFRNPVIVWNHHPNRLTGKQPEWLLRAGSNRVWCAEQLGWDTVPAVVSTRGEIPPIQILFHDPIGVTLRPINDPLTLDDYFPDGGKLWANEHGFGLLAAPKPEITYAGYQGALLSATENYGRTKIINPLKDDK